jgi:membrane fusion protein (multidrug efflux system)
VKRADVATAAADVASAKASLRQAELDLAYTQVKSPVTGVASRHMVDVGNLVEPGTTVLTRVEAFDPIHVYFAVSEADVLEFMRVRGDKPLDSIRENPPVIYMGLSTEEGFPHEGKLDFAEAGVDPDTGTQMRRGVFPNPDRKMLPGHFARVRLPDGDPQPGLMIPDRAVAADQRGDYVLVVNDKNIIEYRPVKLGMRVGQMRVVTEGVGPQDWIVINGLQRARPGAPVKPERTSELDEAKNLRASHDPALAPVVAEASQRAENSTSPGTTAAGAGGN